MFIVGFLSGAVIGVVGWSLFLLYLADERDKNHNKNYNKKSIKTKNKF